VNTKMKIKGSIKFVEFFDWLRDWQILKENYDQLCRMVSYDVSMAVYIRIVILWLETPCSVAVRQHRFGILCCLHFQGVRTRKIST
jgi:hypothetical protein